MESDHVQSEAIVFPPADRVIYRKSPLVEVIAQVRFPTDLRVDTTPPAEFQQRVRELFPLLTQRHRVIPVPVPPELLRLFESAPTGRSTVIWQFQTEDGLHTLELLKDTLTLISRGYRRWEQFYNLLSASLSALVDLYQPPFYTRVGLRYRDIIQRSALGLANVSWTELLKPFVTAEIGQESLEQRVVDASRHLVLELARTGTRVQLQHGLAEVENSKERAYVIDCDFFAERTEVSHADRALQYFHGNAARFFRWCITDKLHHAMEPVAVSAE